MANLDLSNRRRSTGAGALKFDWYSEVAMTGKSSRGNVASEKLERPASTVRRPAALSAVRLINAPSGSLRTISCNVVAETVVAPARSTCAAALSTTSMSRSVARNDASEPSASISTLARIGMVLRRSTTDWACDTALSSAARSMLNFICHLHSGSPGGQTTRYQCIHKSFVDFSARNEGPSRPSRVFCASWCS